LTFLLAVAKKLRAVWTTIKSKTVEKTVPETTIEAGNRLHRPVAAVKNIARI